MGNGDNKMKSFIKRIIRKIRAEYAMTSSERYIKYLRTKGVRIGQDCMVLDPRDIQVDVSRPELLEIGDHVFLHKGTIIMTHDWAGWCFVYSHNEFIPSHAKVKIGNNVWLGENVTICKGVTIGDNCIIGIGAIVTKNVPANSVAVGVPARVICSYEEYYQKRKQLYTEEAIEYARAIIDCGREPCKKDFYDDYPCFVDGNNYIEYNYPYSRVFDPDEFEKWKQSHKRTFNGFEDFMKQVNNSK